MDLKSYLKNQIDKGNTDWGSRSELLRASKTKIRNVGANSLIDKSTNSASGTAAAGSEFTLNDGLTYGNYPFGTRVQDKVISLNIPDIITLYGVFESNDTSDPLPPSMTVGSMDGPTGTASDLILGEEVIGQVSGARAIYISKVSDTSIRFIYENQTVFRSNELFKIPKLLFDPQQFSFLLF